MLSSDTNPVRLRLAPFRLKPSARAFGLALLALSACDGRSHAKITAGVGGSPGGGYGGGREAGGAPNPSSDDLGGAGGEATSARGGFSDGGATGRGGTPGTGGETLAATGGRPTLTGPNSGVPACAVAGKSTIVTCLDIDASALIADTARGKLYAVVKGGASQHANELVVIDPEQGTVEASVVVGSDPAALALSDDGTRLWVSLEGALALREVDLTRSPPEPGAQYPLPRLYEEAYAATLVVPPGEPESVAFAYQYEHSSPSAADAVLVDSGVPRAKRLASPPGTSALALGPAGYLFGVDDDGTLLTIVVSSDGLTATPHPSIVRGVATSLVYDHDFLFTNGGQVLDVTSPDTPKVAGTFAQTGLVVPHASDFGAVVLTNTYDPSAHDATMPTSTTQALDVIVLRHMSLVSFAADAELTLDGHYYDVANLVEPKPGLFAFVDYQIPSAPNPRTVRAGVVVVRAPELAQ